jgi:hypothetical protein
MNASLSYFNTNNETGEVLMNSEIKAKNQEDLIMTYFRTYKDWCLTPFELQKRLNLFNVPITSIRRAMTNLTRKGFLIKSVQMRNGIYGKLNYCWELNKIKGCDSP